MANLHKSSFPLECQIKEPSNDQNYSFSAKSILKPESNK